MATQVNSVLGPLETGRLGFTLAHEHIIVVPTPMGHAYQEFIYRDEVLKKGVTALKEAYAEGVRTIVDVTPFDSGRDVELMRDVSRGSGVQIICCTGCWLDIPRSLWDADPDMVASLFVRDITKGIERTDIRAGIIKVANDIGGVTKPGEVVLRAAARAQKATGVPISTHTWAPERVGDQQIRIFQEEGVDLKHVYIGHSNDTADIEYLSGIIEKGAWLGLDRYPGGDPGTPDWKQRTDVLKRLIDAGYGNRIMLGHDWDVTLTMGNKKQRAELDEQYNPDGYLFITRKVLPRLRESGVPEEVIRGIMVDNPRRFFEGRG